MADYFSYPVVVEYTQRHIVWVESDSHERAVERLTSWPYESTHDDETLFESGLSVYAPKDPWDWKDVYGDFYCTAPYTTEADAHVQTHQQEMYRRQREADKAACVAAGHPEVERYASGRVYCTGCREYIEATAAEAGAR